MGFLNRLLGNDQQRAETKYADRESASQTAARKRRQGHHRNTQAAARQGQAWETRDRARDRKGGWRSTDWT